MRAFEWRENRSEARVVMGSWLTAALMGAKDFPSLDDMLEPYRDDLPPKRERGQSASEMSSAVAAWNATVRVMGEDQERRAAAGR